MTQATGPATAAAAAIARSVVAIAVQTGSPLTYRACQRRIDDMIRAGGHRGLVAGLCNVRTVKSLAAARLRDVANRPDLLRFVRPTPQQLAFLKDLDASPDASADGVILRNCAKNGWTTFDGRRWALTSRGRDAARNSGDYWVPTGR